MAQPQPVSVKKEQPVVPVKKAQEGLPIPAQDLVPDANVDTLGGPSTEEPAIVSPAPCPKCLELKRPCSVECFVRQGHKAEDWDDAYGKNSRFAEPEAEPEAPKPAPKAEEKSRRAARAAVSVTATGIPRDHALIQITHGSYENGEPEPKDKRYVVTLKEANRLKAIGVAEIVFATE